MSKHVIRLTKELTDMREKMGHTTGSSDSEDEEPQIKSEEKITEEMVERMEEKLESAQGDQKNLFLIIFQVDFLSLRLFLFCTSCATRAFHNSSVLFIAIHNDS